MAVPAVGGSAGDGPAGFDAWLDELCRQHPVLLVVDDLQWADQSTLDVLMYVLAGLVGCRLAVVATIRTGEGEPLRRWLPDVRRFPGVCELTLGRLDRVATGEQLVGLLGGPPHQSLVDDVYARSDGNAYLTTLLVSGLSSEARWLPSGLPTELREAVTRAWHGLSRPSRALTQLVAVAGRPQRPDQLHEVAAATTVHDLVPSLREAVNATVLEVGPDETYWFVHPLLAEVLEQELLPEERKTLHAAFAAALQQEGNADEISVEQVVDLADHHYRAGHPQEAYRWALVAAKAAERAGGASEELRLLNRALYLWPDVPDAGISRLDLLQRIRAAAETAAALEEELSAVEELLAMVDRTMQPLLGAALLFRRTFLQQATGRRFAALDNAQEAVRISKQYPTSAEHALAMAELARVELWHGLPSGPANARKAVRLARACGSAKALAYALTAKVMAGTITDEGDADDSDAEEAQAAAAQAGDFMAFAHATTWAAGRLDCPASREVLDRRRRGREALAAMGAPHLHIAWLSADEAAGLLQRGDWRSCEERLRIVLGSTPGPKPDASARLTAALLACRQSRLVEAQAHLARAEELVAAQSEFLALEFDAVRAELAAAAGDTERALSAAMAGLQSEGVPPTLCERLLPIAALAVADQAQALRDRGDDPQPAVARLDDVRSRYPTVVAETGPGPMYQAQVRAMQAWYDAEIRRGREEPGAVAGWESAAQACADAELAWDEAYAWWRAGEALTKDRAARDAAVSALRRAHELAVDLQAAPLLANIEALAQGARISLAVVDEPPLAGIEALPDLTAREREVLAHVVAGRTHGEIARELVISQKTVSVHVSNLLRKSGTANRVELAQLALRLTNKSAD